MISDFRRNVDEICALLGSYAMYSDNSLQTFRDDFSVPTSKVKNDSLTLEDGTDGFSEKSVRNYHSALRTQPRRT